MTDPFIYQYSIGSVVFLAGIVVGWRQGYLGTSGSGLRNLLLLLAGLAFMGGLQGWLQYAPMSEAPAVTYQGEPYERKRMGTDLDYGIMIAYFVAMLAIGTWFGRHNRSTKDFFFGGQ
ncbi:MAG: hypothetical protein QGG40_04605, partial [Myxococcota bacterium]|nr:hypothetical protein [Myxococcota bacterium]